MKKIAITGGRGKVGRALATHLSPEQFQVTSLDLPDCDASNLDQLVEATKGHDAVVHLAWAVEHDNSVSGTLDGVNADMMFNVYQAALLNGIPRVIMASSTHAHRYDRTDPTDGKIRHTTFPQVPDSPYGAQKLLMEGLGRTFANDHGLEVVCVRIGNVNEQDQPNSETPPRWLSHRDLGGLVTASLLAERIYGGELEVPGFETMYGVSEQGLFDISNSFGYVPQDRAIQAAQ